jgi:DNA-binding NarL/FixJ family response regulator
MRAQQSIRIVVVDDHPIFRLGVKALLADKEGFEVVGEASDGEQALELVSTLQPDILLLDYRLPRLSGLDVLRRLAAARSAIRVILLAATIDESEIRTALLHNAWGVILKHTASKVLAGCIRQVMRGERWVGLESVNPLIGGLRSQGYAEGRATLTPREFDVAERIAQGASNKEIAAQLALSEQTVKNYLRRIFEKFKVGNRVELALQMRDQLLPGNGGSHRTAANRPDNHGS